MIVPRYLRPIAIPQGASGLSSAIGTTSYTPRIWGNAENLSARGRFPQTFPLRSRIENWPAVENIGTELSYLYGRSRVGRGWFR